MSSFNWREVPLFIWVIILFALAIPLLVSDSSSDFIIKQPSDAAAKTKLNTSTAPVSPSPSYVDQIIKPEPPPAPTPPSNLPGGAMHDCRYILGNSESYYSDCSGCRGTYLEGDMPVCVAP